MRVSIFENYFKPEHQHVETSWAQMAKAFCVFRPKTAKKLQRSWSPTYFTGVKRSKKNSLSLSCLVFDLDDGIDNVNDVISTLTEKNLNYAVHTSSSSKEEIHRFRVILPFTTPVQSRFWSNGTYPNAVNLWRELGFRGNPDKKALKDCARIYSLPYISPHMVSAMSASGDYVDQSFSGLIQIIKETHYKCVREREVKKSISYLRSYLNSNSSVSHPSHTDDDQHNKHLCNADEMARRIVAERLGATIRDGKVTGWTCPNCHQSDATYYYLTAGTRAFCSHRSSCTGYAQPLYHLAHHYGVLPR